MFSQSELALSQAINNQGVNGQPVPASGLSCHRQTNANFHTRPRPPQQSRGASVLTAVSTTCSPAVMHSSKKKPVPPTDVGAAWLRPRALSGMQWLWQTALDVRFPCARAARQQLTSSPLRPRCTTDKFQVIQKHASGASPSIS